MQTRIGIIGGGMMGLTIAQRLSARGCHVTVFERDRQLGGLSTYQDYGPFWWDRFYHVILPVDTHLIGFLRDIGLGSHIRWNTTRTGLYVDERCYSLSNTLELLKFPLVGLIGKLRLALAVLRCARIEDWKSLEAISVEDWLTRMCGRHTYDKFWKPLLLAKLGEHHQRVSAVFIWTYIKRIYSARSTAAKREQLGHVAGGYRTVITRVEDLIRSAGGEVRAGTRVTAIRDADDGGLWIEWDGQREHFDKIVCTSPVDVLKRLAGPNLLNMPAQDGTVEYLGVVCVVLMTRRPITPYYVLNIADARIPFTGVIGMSTVVSTDETAGFYVTYLPKYVLSDDPLLHEEDEAIRRQFIRGFTLIFPDVREEDIVGARVHRAAKVQPLQVLHYSTLVPAVTTAHDDFFVLNTSQFVNGTLNNNEVVRAVDTFLTEHGARLSRSHQGRPAVGLAMASSTRSHNSGPSAYNL